MGIFDNKYYVYAQNKWIYHIILFGGFVAAVKILPWLQTKISAYLDNVFLLEGAALLAAYIAAVYILPEVGFMIYKAMNKD